MNACKPSCESLHAPLATASCCNVQICCLKPGTSDALQSRVALPAADAPAQYTSSHSARQRAVYLLWLIRCAYAGLLPDPCCFWCAAAPEPPPKHSDSASTSSAEDTCTADSTRPSSITHTSCSTRPPSLPRTTDSQSGLCTEPVNLKRPLPEAVGVSVPTAAAMAPTVVQVCIFFGLCIRTMLGCVADAVLCLMKQTVMTCILNAYMDFPTAHIAAILSSSGCPRQLAGHACLMCGLHAWVVLPVLQQVSCPR